MCAAIGQAGTAAAVYVAVACVMCLQTRWAWLVSVAVALTTYAATLWVPGWQRDEGILFGTLVATLAIWGITQAINRNIEVLSVREENARLALDDERNRFARDLHDILGHSLTVITVKAELANRLIDVDPERARAELGDLERLSRDALTDVRRAVEGYRELTLARRAVPGPDRAVGRRDRGRPAQLHRRGAAPTGASSSPGRCARASPT